MNCLVSFLEVMTMMVVCMEEGTHTRSINGEVERPFMMSIEPLENVHFSEISNSFFPSDGDWNCFFPFFFHETVIE